MLCEVSGDLSERAGLYSAEQVALFESIVRARRLEMCLLLLRVSAGPLVWDCRLTDWLLLMGCEENAYLDGGVQGLGLEGP